MFVCITIKYSLGRLCFFVSLSVWFFVIFGVFGFSCSSSLFYLNDNGLSFKENKLPLSFKENKLLL